MVGDKRTVLLGLQVEKSHPVLCMLNFILNWWMMRFSSLCLLVYTCCWVGLRWRTLWCSTSRLYQEEIRLERRWFHGCVMALGTSLVFKAGHVPILRRFWHIRGVSFFVLCGLICDIRNPLRNFIFLRRLAILRNRCAAPSLSLCSFGPCAHDEIMHQPSQQQGDTGSFWLPWWSWESLHLFCHRDRFWSRFWSGFSLLHHIEYG